jgi:ATP-dependent Clp protease ATP-binding subunit ClpC
MAPEDPVPDLSATPSAADSLLQMAREEAERLGHPYIGPEHFLLGLLRTDSPDLRNALDSLAVTPADVRARIEAATAANREKVSLPRSEFPFTSRAKRVLKLAEARAREAGSLHIEAIQLYEAILHECDSVAAHILREAGAPGEAAYRPPLQMLEEQLKAAGLRW